MWRNKDEVNQRIIIEKCAGIIEDRAEISQKWPPASESYCTVNS